LSLVALFHVAVNVVWQVLDKAPPTWDSAGHLGLSFLFADRIPALINANIKIVDFLQISNYYPPLIHIIGGFLILFFGRNYFSALFLSTVFFVVAIIYLYEVVLVKFNNQKLALLTVLIFSFFPHVWQQSREFHLDVPLVAFLLMSYYHLIKSDALLNKKHSLLFFVFLVLTQLTKWYGFVFLIVPFFYEVVLQSYRRRDFFSKSRLLNVLNGVILIGVFCFPWYLVNYKNIINTVKITSQGELGDPQNVFSFESLFEYLKLLIPHQIGFLSFVLVVISMYLLNRKRVAYRFYLFYSVLVPYIIFTIIQNKDLRYILPLTPMFALYIALIFWQFNFRFKKVLLGLFFAYLLFMFFFMSLNQYQKLPDKLLPLAYLIGGPYYQGWYYTPNFYSYNPYDWRGDEIIRAVESDAAQEPLIRGQYKVLELSDNQYYSLASFEMYRRQNNFENMEIVVPYFQFNPFTPTELQNYMQSIEFALVPTNPGPSGLRNIVVLNQLVAYFRSDQNLDFTKISSFKMPDGNTLDLYKRVNFINYKSASIRDDSLKIYVGGILFIDRKQTGGLQFKVDLYDTNGKLQIVDVVGGDAERRISLVGMDRFKIELPLDQQDVRDLRGWQFKDGEFKRSTSYDAIVKDSNNEFTYNSAIISPKSKSYSSEPPVVNVMYAGKNINIKLNDLTQKSFIAFATKGWVWNNVWLSAENPDISIPTEDLVQLEVSQGSQLIQAFPENWGFFICYEGKAICFYPIFPGL
ncbi:MAG TPA: glycosyltransferase family 39 protein, partial [Candidatus Saccharimonadales bacterium]|nr:glycosyltransferase family 39 protein [Candidatus Saccharimonadales bacterium]